VEITSVQQQYPCTNTVDITYTSTGIAEQNTYYVIFKAQDSAGNEIGVITNDLKVSRGSTWVAQWQPPFNVRYENCTMTPYVYKGGMDDYMVVDLETWQVTFEPMSTQDASNKKYTANDYKTKKMVFRKIEPGTYKIGYANGAKNESASGPNSAHDCVAPKAYYVAIYSCTEGQFRRITGDTSVADTTLPKVQVSFNSVRGGAGAAATPQTGVIAQLNAKTASAGFASGSGFDLPTESMWEIAARAGATTQYIWGDTLSDYAAYAWVSDNSGGANRKNVGDKLPNAWGLFDMCGNVWDITRDVARNNSTDLATISTQAQNCLQPITSGKAGYEVLCGTSSPDKLSRGFAAISQRWLDWTVSQSGVHVGFRIAFIPE
ncbi:MAG: SUMF1/EgtB/PvdO family nonheme iron enzyme, partial [Kiritimatiellae bacterium]|nr:SUMF1/EgtB/PvdO family nonheme iron enzyme [Kiritimatiellia bacterium]